jgi:hypothetical protein
LNYFNININIFSSCRIFFGLARPTSYRCVCADVKVLLSTHRSFRYIASGVAKFLSLDIFRQVYMGVFLSSSQAVPPRGNTSLRLQGSHFNATRLNRELHAEVSPIGSLA